MITRKQVRNLQMYKDVKHHVRSKSMFISIWMRPDIFFDNFAPAEIIYQVTKIDGSGISSVKVSSPDEAWEKYKKAISL